MGFNLPGWFLPLIAVLALVAIALGIVKIIRLSRSSEKPRDKKTNGYRAVTLLCVVVMFASWIINIGWLRIFLTWIPIPLVHTIAFIIVNFKAIKNIAYSDKLKKYVPWSWGTYLTAYLLFPDVPLSVSLHVRSIFVSRCIFRNRLIREKSFVYSSLYFFQYFVGHRESSLSFGSLGYRY